MKLTSLIFLYIFLTALSCKGQENQDYVYSDFVKIKCVLKKDIYRVSINVINKSSDTLFITPMHRYNVKLWQDWKCYKVDFTTYIYQCLHDTVNHILTHKNIRPQFSLLAPKQKSRGLFKMKNTKDYVFVFRLFNYKKNSGIKFMINLTKENCGRYSTVNITSYDM